MLQKEKRLEWVGLWLLFPYITQPYISCSELSLHLWGAPVPSVIVLGKKSHTKIGSLKRKPSRTSAVAPE